MNSFRKLIARSAITCLAATAAQATFGAPICDVGNDDGLLKGKCQMSIVSPKFTGMFDFSPGPTPFTPNLVPHRLRFAAVPPRPGDPATEVEVTLEERNQNFGGAVSHPVALVLVVTQSGVEVAGSPFRFLAQSPGTVGGQVTRLTMGGFSLPNRTRDIDVVVMLDVDPATTTSARGVINESNENDNRLAFSCRFYGTDHPNLGVPGC